MSGKYVKSRHRREETARINYGTDTHPNWRRVSRVPLKAWLRMQLRLSRSQHELDAIKTYLENRRR